MFACGAPHPRKWHHLQYLQRSLGADRAWEIDIVPFLNSADEWRYIERESFSAPSCSTSSSSISTARKIWYREADFPAELALRQSSIPAAPGRCVRVCPIALISSYACSP